MTAARFAAVERGTDQGGSLRPPVVAVGHLVRAAPAPGREHGPVHGAALVQEIRVGPHVVLRSTVGSVGEVELDRPAAARGEVHEERLPLRGEEVALVWLAVQQLVAGPVRADRCAHLAQGAGEEFPVGSC